MSSGDSGFSRRLHVEIDQWQADGLITAEQASAIRQRYDLDESGGGSAIGNRTVSVVAIMGSALIGLGIIAFIAANWSDISTLARLALMIIGTPAIYIAGWVLSFRFGYLRIGTAVILLGAIAFGASIHLIAQTYHVPVNHPNLVPLWFLGVVPLAYIMRSKAVLVLSIGLFLVAAGFRAQEWLPELDDELIVFLVPTYLLFGAAIFAAGRLQMRFSLTQPFTRIFDVFGLLVAFAAVYVFSYHELWEGLVDERNKALALGILSVEYWLVTGVTAAVALTVVGTGWWRDRGAQYRLPWWETSAVAAMVVIAAGMWAGLMYGGEWMWWVFNLVILGGVLGMIAAGYRWNREFLINLAIIIFAITLLTRYFEFGFSLLGQSVAFMVAGVILLAGGFALEFLRRRMLRRIRLEGSA